MHSNILQEHFPFDESITAKHGPENYIFSEL